MGLIRKFLELFGSKTGNDRHSRSNILIAKLITIDELENQLSLLQNGLNEYDFIGITSNGIDCIYFLLDGDKIQIEFEAMVSEQLPYIDLIQGFAKANNVEVINKSYGNTPNFDSAKTAPVIRLVINADISRASEIGREIQSAIFKNNELTKYDVVP